jgi:hypothetical protein
MNPQDHAPGEASMPGFVLDGAVGPAARLPRAQLEVLADAVVTRARARTPSRRAHVVWLAAAAIVVVATVASAAVWVGRARVRRTPSAQGVAAQPVVVTPRAARRVEAAPGAMGVSIAASTAPGTTPPAEPPPRRASSGVAAPPDLLRAASRLRAQRRWRDAEGVYAQVAATVPGSEPAYAATLAAASLRLEHLGDARGALRLFEAALRRRPDGGLAEEARFGVAEAYRALGDGVAEARALRAFLAAHPDAAMRPRAVARLRELGGAGAAP